MHGQEAFLANETHKILRDFDRETGHLILSGRPDLIHKIRTFQIVDLSVPADHRVRLKERENRDKYLDLTRVKKITIIQSPND